MPRITDRQIEALRAVWEARKPQFLSNDERRAWKELRPLLDRSKCVGMGRGDAAGNRATEIKNPRLVPSPALRRVKDQSGERRPTTVKK